jgi:hypothetical protein
MIPVKFYIAVMLIAGAVTFLYGVAEASMNTVLGSFLFFGIGGFAYYAWYRKR